MNNDEDDINQALAAYDKKVKKLQAEAKAKLMKEFAEAEAAEKAAKLADPFKAERRLFTHDLVRIRLKKKISQNDLADKTGIKQAHISRLESGRANPSLTTLFKIAKALDANLRLD